MSLRKATLLAAAGIGAGIVAGLGDNFRFYSQERAWIAVWSPGWTIAAHYVAQILKMLLFVLLYREMGGKGQPRQRQDLAIVAVLASCVLLQLNVSATLANLVTLHRQPGIVVWLVFGILLALAWTAFLILLVKDAEPLRSRPMRALAPILAVLTIVEFCHFDYMMFFRVGMAWMDISSQRSLGAVVWNLFAYPLLELFREVSMIVFLVLLWRCTWKRIELAPAEDRM